MVEIGLAPMEGTTDFPTRLWFALTSGPKVVTSPFLRVTPSYPAPQFEIADYWPELCWARSYLSYTLIPQLMAASADDFTRVAERVLRDSSVVELNCGCPSPKVVGHGAGSSLLLDPQVFFKTLSKIASEIDTKRFRVKMRTGFAQEEEFAQLLTLLGALNLSRLTVHGRTRVQQYQGFANWDLIGQAAAQLKYPVCGSGDIVDKQSLLQRLEQAEHVNAVIIGRGALANPWIFAEFDEELCSHPSRAVEVASITVYALLQFGFHAAPDRLRAVVEQGIFAQGAIGANLNRWQEVAREISILILGNEAAELADNIPRQLLGRVKMMWRYMQSQVSAQTPRNPQLQLLLRTSTMRDFFAQLQT